MNVQEDRPARRVEVYRDGSGQFRWRKVATANGKVVADGSEGYTRREEAHTAAARENPGVPVVVVDG